MNELIVAAQSRKMLHSRFLGTVCTLALASMLTGQAASAAQADADHPTVWIELGGQLERLSGQGEPFTPDFATVYADSSAFEQGTAMQTQRNPPYSKGLQGKITFTPQGSDWSVSAALVYGRSNSTRRVHQQTAGVPLTEGRYGHGNPQLDPVPIKAYSDVRDRDAESHLLLDFKVGKDVGLGVLGSQSTSKFSFGLRVAQFTSSKNVGMVGRPEVHLTGRYFPVHWRGGGEANGGVADSETLLSDITRGSDERLGLQQEVHRVPALRASVHGDEQLDTVGPHPRFE